MPKGNVHRITTLAIASISGIVLAKTGTLPLDQAIAFASGCSAGILLTPDLDLIAGSDGQNMARRAFGRPVAAAWRIFWLPYSIFIRHRSSFSHGPIIGTIIRLLYVSIPIGLILFGISRLVSLPATPIFTHYALIATIGLMTADTAHFIMDKILPG